MHLKQISSPLWMRPSRRPEPLRMPKRSRWICFRTRMLWNMPWSSRSNENSEIHTYVGQQQTLLTYKLFQRTRHGRIQRAIRRARDHTMDHSHFQPLNEQPCRNYQCNGNKKLDATDAAHPSFIVDQNTMLAFTPNGQDTSHTIARSLSRVLFCGG